MKAHPRLSARSAKLSVTNPFKEYPSITYTSGLAGVFESSSKSRYIAVYLKPAIMTIELNKRQSLVPLVILVILLVASGCFRSSLQITRNGISKHDIVIPANADSTIQRAAQELSHYLKEISGVEIPVITVDKQDQGRHALYVGLESNAETDSPYTIAYEVVENDLYIYGGNGKSTLYAVYRFLENERR